MESWLHSKMEVCIVHKSNLWADLVQEDEFQKVIESVLCELDLQKQFSNAIVSVVLADDVLVKSLNNQFRGKDSSTNVLSFPAVDINIFDNDIDEETNIGDIVFSFETITCEAKIQHKLIKDHFFHLLIHGFLHILGYTHDNEEDARQMESLEIEILKTLNISNPYQLL